MCIRDRVYSELLPGDKVSRVEELLEQKGPKEKLAFVGDGINDAPVLSRADIGIAMGAMAVSYTHLDVYKRQIVKWAARSLSVPFIFLI